MYYLYGVKYVNDSFHVGQHDRLTLGKYEKQRNTHIDIGRSKYKF